ncbi:MAG TPA: hypothetical protein VKG38_08970 [Solirubrobacteraceae bacterium]|nr:hypothetical protein [Solirubrobacteraceae bacterium]
MRSGFHRQVWLALTAVVGLGFLAGPAQAGEAPTPISIAPLTVAEARALVRVIIEESTGKAPQRLGDPCTSRNTHRVVCKPSWTSAFHLSSSTLLYSGKLALEETREGLHYSFVGLRWRYGCARRLGAKRCASRVDFHLS